MGRPPTYLTASGQVVSFGRRLGGGGEGEIYELTSDSSLVAKLYHKAPESKKASKLVSMVQQSFPSISKFAAWPVTTLHEGSNRTLRGFIMPRIADAQAVHELDTPAGRRVNFPTADWRFLIRTARNCAAAMAALHDVGIVLGDVNLGGFLVNRNALVNIIDCDSFQIRSPSEVFHCVVAVPEFLPPELHKCSLDSTIRSQNHDAFGLAIIIFRLLMMGRHPFAGYRGKGDKPIPEAIREYRFAFGPDAATLQMAPPPHSLLLSDLPLPIATNFVQAFSRGSERPDARPSAKLWCASLDQFESQLNKCAIDPGHYHFSGLKECPWCRIERGNGPNYFISVSINVLSAAPAHVDIVGVWSQIIAIQEPNSWLAAVKQAQPIRCVATPLPENFNSDEAFLRYLGYIAAGSCALLFFPPVGMIVCACIVALWFILRANSPHYKEIQARQQALAHRQAEQKACERTLHDSLARHAGEHKRRIKELSNVRDRFNSLHVQESNEIKQLQSHARERQLNQYLDKFFIKAAKLKGIGSGRITALESFNIETAADVEHGTIAAVPGFGPKLTSQLIQWRDGLASKFHFDPVRGVPQTDLLKIRNKYLQMRHLAQRQLEAGRAQILQVTAAGKSEIETIAATLAAKRAAEAQARADYELCSAPKSK